PNQPVSRSLGTSRVDDAGGGTRTRRRTGRDRPSHTVDRRGTAATVAATVALKSTGVDVHSHSSVGLGGLEPPRGPFQRRMMPGTGRDLPRLHANCVAAHSAPVPGADRWRSPHTPQSRGQPYAFDHIRQLRADGGRRTPRRHTSHTPRRTSCYRRPCDDTGVHCDDTGWHRMTLRGYDPGHSPFSGRLRPSTNCDHPCAYRSYTAISMM